jgi:hypothetical protein
MSRRIPKEDDRYYCAYCGFPCKEGRDSEGNYGLSGWDFSEGATSGDNLISNGTFTTNTTGWTAEDCTLSVAAGGQSGKCLTITRTGGSEQYAYQALSGLTQNSLYRLQAYVKSGTSGAEAFILRAMDNGMARTLASTTGTSFQTTGTSSSSWVKHTLVWRAYGTNDAVCLVKNTATAGTMLFDTVTVYAVDYWVKEFSSGCGFCHSKNWKG